MRFLIVRLELESSKENGFRVVQIAHFEAHEPQVEVKGIGFGVELDELAIDAVGLPVLLLLEIGEAEEVDDRVVVRPKTARLFELLGRVDEIPSVEMLAPAVQMYQEQALGERCRRLVGHKRQLR